MKSNERFVWAASVMNVSPSANILEIGCGAGIFIQEMLKYLKTGTVTAIDRSESMIKMASKRHSEAIANKRLELIKSTCAETALKQKFDVIAAFNVNFFWQDAYTEFSNVKTMLRRRGSLFVFHRPPNEIGEKSADLLKRNLEKYSFSIVDTKFKMMKPTSVIAVHATI